MTKIVFVVITIIVVAIVYFFGRVTSIERVVNDLGLTEADMKMGELANIETLRVNTKTIADAYLVKRQADLTDLCGEAYVLSADYSLTPKIRSLGYKSSFYYYCWDIYLPYSLKAESGDKYIVLVQLSDKTAGNKHDPENFHVLRAMVIDNKNEVTKQFEE